jgi:hypothetical protein
MKICCVSPDAARPLFKRMRAATDITKETADETGKVEGRGQFDHIPNADPEKVQRGRQVLPLEDRQ